MEIIVGIDLGTTNSEICYLDKGKPVMIEIDNQSFMPSCVGLDDQGSLLVGQMALNQAISRPESTILSIKRQMGETSKVALGEKEYSPEEISSLILMELKKHAEEKLGKKIHKTIITVPAYFDDTQRNATKVAGELAGLDVMRIINEPTAAAVAYQAGHDKNHTILVYDLGGGTFDVSLVVVEDGVVEVKASHGDTSLGGDDFDELLMDYVAQAVKEENDIDLLGDIKTKSRLRSIMEKAKKELSDHPYSKISEEFLSGDFHLEREILRENYEELIRPLLKKTLDCIHRCLKDASLLPMDIDKVILVGGSSRTPLVHELITQEIGIEPRYEINPDLIVAMGASIQGAAIAGQKTSSILVDITPYTFGTSAMAVYEGVERLDVYIPVIKRNTPLPVNKGEFFYTVHDNQEEVNVKIFQGEAPLVDDNIFIGNFCIEGLSKVEAGNKILLTLELDINGILEVTAEEKKTGRSKKVRMDTKEVNRTLDLEEARKNLASLVPDSLTSSKEDLVDDKDDVVVKAKNLKIRAENLLSELNEEDKKEIKELLLNSRDAIKTKDFPLLKEINESLEDMIFYLED